MKNARKAGVIIMAVLLVSLAVGCNKGGGAVSAPDSTKDIVFWDMMWGPANSYPQAMQGLISRFNSENGENIRVTLQSLPWDNYYQVFLTAVTSGVAPDVSTGAFLQPLQYAEMGEGLSLDPVVDAWRSENNPILNEYNEDILNLFRYEGKRYGLPWNLDTRQITYRTDYFQQAGITALPATWAEFEAVCARLKAALPPDVFPFVFPGGGDYSGLHPFLTFLVQNDVGPTDVDGQPDYLNPKITEVLQFVNRLYVNNYIPEGLPSYRSETGRQMYQAGKVAMILDNLQELQDFPDVFANSGILPPVAGPSGTAKYYTWVNAIEAYSQTKNPDACITFVKWLLENELPLWTSGGAAMPARSSYRADPQIANDKLKKQVSELVLPTAVTPVYPAKSAYMAFSIIEGEAIPMVGMIRAMTRNPDYQVIQREVQESMLNAWEEFEQ
ncbi:MAG: sugar ABC transporter substrate-binding protein [Treponema sp.]|nr:sugar ABC transporter substrate-binding protein [Treponema sp.]